MREWPYRMEVYMAPTTTPASLSVRTLPDTPAQAQRELEYWQARLALAQLKFAVARRQMEQAQADLDLVKAVARGEFEPDEPKSNGYVMSSRGPWCLGDQR